MHALSLSFYIESAVSDKNPSLVRFNTGPLADPTLGQPKRPISGNALFRSVAMFEGDEGNVHGGVWESTSGTFQADTTGYIEFGHIVEGSCRVVDPDSTVNTLETGDSFVMPEGYHGRWEVDSFVKKIYFITKTA